MSWGGSWGCRLSLSRGGEEGAKTPPLTFISIFFNGVFKVQPHKSGSCFPRLTAFRASFTGVILNVVLGGLAAGRGFLYPNFGGKQIDFNLIFFFK